MCRKESKPHMNEAEVNILLDTQRCVATRQEPVSPEAWVQEARLQIPCMHEETRMPQLLETTSTTFLTMMSL